MVHTAHDAQRLEASRRDLTRRLAGTFARTAVALEDSARLADQDADRQESNGRPERCASERAIARRARAGAKKARANAAHLAEPASRPSAAA